MKIKQYPELSEKYPAIDGIAKKGFSREPRENAIRSDVEDILKMDDIAFDSWYRQRESALLGLLNPLRIAVTVPELRYASEEQKNTLNAHSSINMLHKSLESGLGYIQIIKKVRDDRVY